MQRIRIVRVAKPRAQLKRWKCGAAAVFLCSEGEVFVDSPGVAVMVFVLPFSPEAAILIAFLRRRKKSKIKLPHTNIVTLCSAIPAMINASPASSNALL